LFRLAQVIAAVTAGTTVFVAEGDDPEVRREAAARIQQEATTLAERAAAVRKAAEEMHEQST
jgi:hypothetical protein